MDKLHTFKRLKNNTVINIREIKNFTKYSAKELEELIDNFQVGTYDYDQVIDRLFFHDPADRRQWRCRTDAHGRTIQPARVRFDNRFREIADDKYLVNFC